jgi:hypothetical protein
VWPEHLLVIKPALTISLRLRAVTGSRRYTPALGMTVLVGQAKVVALALAHTFC